MGRVGVTLKTKHVRHKRQVKEITLSVRVKPSVHEKILDITEYYREHGMAKGEKRVYPYSLILSNFATWYYKEYYDLLLSGEKKRRFELILKRNGDIIIKEVDM